MISRIHIITLSFLCVCFVGKIYAQFSPAAGIPGSDAIHKDDASFVGWAKGCTLSRGYLDVTQPDSGLTTLGNETSAIGPAGQNGVVSLGDGGYATLTFDKPLMDGSGFDFAVFENGFPTGDSTLAFLEFATVSVSSDGVNFFTFPVTSHIQDTTQLAMEGIDCSSVNNLAGKYVVSYGTPFDLNELSNEAGLDVNHITHIRVRDVVGSINPLFATYDQYGVAINDPYPTPFPSGGFDLDAVGVIHQVEVSGIALEKRNESNLSIFPNPCSTGHIFVSASYTQEDDLFVIDVAGRVIICEKLSGSQTEINVSALVPGVYMVLSGNKIKRLVIE